MNQSNEKMLAALKSAMEAELTGHHFYKNAASTTSDPQGRETFERLAREELHHFNYLKKQYNSILKTGEFDFSAPLAGRDRDETVKAIFSPQLKSRIQQSHFEITALSVGMQLEMNAVKFYQQCADDSSDPQVKELFQQLADWERGHHEDFVRELDELKEDYWQANNFVPM